ncbi:MAG TPA: hypothetical protein VG273_14510 [Bryobacteraceae bacterium]|jgi:sugar lactone lactonase YvrE|nr:hypothetical protein [Bryobacteraceae bacterium]
MRFLLLLFASAYVQNACAQSPYTQLDLYFHMPAGRPWGATTAVDIDRDGKTIWIAERCGTNTCAGSLVPPVLQYDTAGFLRRSFGEGLLTFPHGICADKDGNVWVTDGKGTQKVWKFSPEGKVLMSLDGFHQPNDVAIASNGDIFVAEGHTAGSGTARIVKLDKDGKFLLEWGKDELDVPHALAFDSSGRLFVGDRENDRILIFDQSGKRLAEWKQFGGPSGLYIDRNDILYAADGDIRIGSVKDGIVKTVIPADAEGVAADAEGNIFGAGVNPPGMKKYVK